MVPKSFTAGWIEPVRSDVEHVPVSDFPLHYFAYHFAPPGVWSQRPPSQDVSPHLVLVDPESMRRFSHGEGFRGGTINPVTFCKMLAKIAHGYGVAHLGLN